MHSSPNIKTRTLHTSLRANPSPNVTNLFCQLPLPLLYYRPKPTTLDKLLPHQHKNCLGHEQTLSLKYGFPKVQSPGGGVAYWPRFQSIFLLEIYTGDLITQIQPMVFVLQFNFKIWGAPKWVTFPSLAKPHKRACLGLLDGHLLCCSKQTNILVVNPKHLHMLSLPQPIDANTLSDATLESDCFQDKGLSIMRRLL